MYVDFKIKKSDGPNINGPQLIARIYPNDDFEVSVWTNVHGIVQVEIKHGGTQEAKMVTAQELNKLS